ncbi:MAG: hypothetical protein V2B18_25495, partial [Pseudomonadota bacterium]
MGDEYPFIIPQTVHKELEKVLGTLKHPSKALDLCRLPKDGSPYFVSLFETWALRAGATLDALTEIRTRMAELDGDALDAKIDTLWVIETALQREFDLFQAMLAFASLTWSYDPAVVKRIQAAVVKRPAPVPAAEETDKVVPAKSLEKVYERVLDVISMYEAIMKLESPDARQREILY